MRKTILILPELAGDPESESLLRELKIGTALAEYGEVGAISIAPKLETPEALYLGLRADEAQMRQGPLTVSALKADPPERSTHFHLSLLSITDGTVSRPELVPTDAELAKITEQFAKLGGRDWTLLKGHELDHALVWEGRGDLLTRTPKEAMEDPWPTMLPQGDAEVNLRRIIDDSVNLLGELELNQRRVDEGLPPFNLLWPWGDGVRVPTPNLALRHGEPVEVESGSLRLAGLTRLVGFRHGIREAFGQGTRTNLRLICERARQAKTLIVLVDAFEGFRVANMQEEMHWLVRELEERLLKPLFEDLAETTGLLQILSPRRDGLGLSLTVQSPLKSGGTRPFDERALDSKLLRPTGLGQCIDATLQS